MSIIMAKTVISLAVLSVFLILALHVTFNNVEGGMAMPPTRPCPPVCDIFCPHGNVMNRWGCPTCACSDGTECRTGYYVIMPRRSCRLIAGGEFQCGRDAQCHSTFGGVEGVCCRRRETVPIVPTTVPIVPTTVPITPSTGQCPMVMPPLHCPPEARPEDCRTDADCGSRRKRCCPVGCGRRCFRIITSNDNGD